MRDDRFSAFERLPTEKPPAGLSRLDTFPTRRLLGAVLREDKRVPAAVAAEKAALARAVELFTGTWRKGGRVLFIGAGTSGRLGVIEAAECPPTFGTPPGRIAAVMAGGASAVFRSKEGAEDDGGDGAAQVRRWRAGRRGGLVVGIAASGVTPFVIGALREAKRGGARTVLVTSNARPALKGVDVVIAPKVGPEVVAGSTRLKAGTAAKLVLNALTTASMIRLGKTYGSLMVEPRLSSRKLRARAVRNVVGIAGVSPARAEALLRASGKSVKAAVLMARGLSRKEARARLEAAGGFLRRALEKA